MTKRLAFLALLLTLPLAVQADLRVDGTVVHPHPSELVGATVVSRINIYKPAGAGADDSVLMTTADLSATVAAGSIDQAPWPVATEVTREQAYTLPAGLSERVDATGSLQTTVILEPTVQKTGVSLATRFAATPAQFAGQVRGEISYVVGSQQVEFRGKDYVVPTIRKAAFEQPVVLGLNRFIVDGMIVEVDIVAMTETLASNH